MRKELLEWLACPACLGSLLLEPENGPDPEIVCLSCHNRYPIIAGLPLLLLKDDHWGKTTLEREGELELVDAVPLEEHIKRNRFETIRTLQVLEKIEIVPGSKVLDVGGSAGFGSYLFKKYDATVVVTDIVPEFVLLADACLHDGMDIHPVPCSMEQLPFIEDVFDVVFCRQTLHHSLEPQWALEEMFRVAKTDGVVVVASEPCFSLADFLYKTWCDFRTPKTIVKQRTITDKLPDQHFMHTWPTFRKWFETLTDDCEIFPSGGAAAMVETDRGFHYETHYRERRFWGKLQQAALPRRWGFRGDVSIVARKTRPIRRRPGEPHRKPVMKNEISLWPLPERVIRNQRSLFPQMFPFPVELSSDESEHRAQSG